MSVNIKKLKLNCHSEPVEISFNKSITFFHGQTASGKSTIFRLIDFCLGGAFPDTIAVQDEVISVELDISLSGENYMLKRDPEQINYIQVYEKTNSDIVNQYSLPIKAARSPIIEPDIHNFSDFILKKLNLPRLIVPYGQKGRSARLSFRDIMWYCYLRQVELDTSFFHMDHRYERIKSQYVIRLVIGNYTEDLNNLKLELARNKTRQIEIKDMIKNTKKFLDYSEYSSEGMIIEEINEIENKVEELKSLVSEKRELYNEETLFINDLQNEASKLILQLDNEKRKFNELKQQVKKHIDFKSEMEYNKIKIIRADSATSILSGSDFSVCPECGIELVKLLRSENSCKLCGSNLDNIQIEGIDTSITLNDIDIRIKEIQELIDLQTEEIEILGKKIPQFEVELNRLNEIIDNSLREFDSRYLSNNVLREKEISTYEERLRNLYKNLEIPKNLEKLDDERFKLIKDEKEINQKIELENNKIKESDKILEEIMMLFKYILIKIKAPHISDDDIATMNKKTWIPEIHIGGDESSSLNFFNAGSSGLKTLLTVSYALAIHIIAEKNELPLPKILMIDTPMSNIGEEVNKEMFFSFYKYIYEVIKGPLKNTQIIIIDKNYVEPLDETELSERFMTIDDPKYPPLFPSYKHGMRLPKE